MTDPLKIMDEIDTGLALTLERGWMVAVTEKDWQSLRTAIEAQAEELAQQEARIARLQLALSHLVERIWTEEQAQEILNESRPQSLAAIKTAVLREVANDIADGYDEEVDVVTWLWEEARQIEREAEGGE